MIWFPSIKHYPIEAGANKSIDTSSQLSFYFNFLSVKSKIYKAKKNLISLKCHLLVYMCFSQSFSVAIIIDK